jgi:hypothetical protein
MIHTIEGARHQFERQPQLLQFAFELRRGLRRLARHLFQQSLHSGIDGCGSHMKDRLRGAGKMGEYNSAVELRADDPDEIAIRLRTQLREFREIDKASHWIGWL